MGIQYLEGVGTDVFIKAPTDTLDFEWDWSIWLPTGDTIAGVTWTAESGITLADVSAPTGLAVVPSTTGGTLASGATFWVITALSANGETTKSNEVTATLTGSTSSAALSWPQVANATGYKVYRGTTTGGENKLLTTINLGSTLTYTDTGTAGATVSPPGSNTAINTSFTSTNATAWISGGTVNNTYTLTCQIATAQGRVASNTQNINVVTL